MSKSKNIAKELLKKLIKFFYTEDKSDQAVFTKKEYYNYVIDNIPEKQLEKAYDKAWEAKNYEIDNYWKRGNYF